MPNQFQVEQLYNMGFPLHLAKKAVALAKNQGVQMALDLIFSLQEEENAIKQLQQKNTSNSNYTINYKQLKPVAIKDDLHVKANNTASKSIKKPLFSDDDDENLDFEKSKNEKEEEGGEVKQSTQQQHDTLPD